MAARGRPRGTANNGGQYGLTPREWVILQHIHLGETNREIARALGLSLHTVKTHVRHVLAKLGVHNRTQAAVRAQELGGF
jgi:DNA-binding NarL/FixJ family response regulator